jgi:thiamine kinase-like enzyme
MDADHISRILELPIWKGDPDISPLTGGLSNASYLVRDRAGGHVVRFGRDYPFHHVFRDREVMTARAAHAAGFAPAVEHAQPGIMVSQFIEARTLGEADVRADPRRIARLIADFHREMPARVSGAAFLFWVFHVIRDYARTLKEGGSSFAGGIETWLAEAAELEEAQAPLPLIFGHNDLLPANFLDDGERLWLIDFEYAGFSTAMFDLAGAASNSGMDEAQSLELLTAYLGESPSAPLLRAHAAMQCASLLREAMWGMVSQLHLDAPGVDYDAYARENLERYAVALERYRTRHGKPAR